jgi:hypothetical protein
MLEALNYAEGVAYAGRPQDAIAILIGVIKELIEDDKSN